ncbi:MAG: SAM-dependent methyltransferase [Hyphomicrobiaceae bacterium]|nr:SAM-dependent methyltransferase [Hyphomicrobiaceae bacterium]
MASRPSLPPDYFEGMFRSTPDPWGFETKPYEQAKYDHTISALGGRRYASGLEVGCANGVLTQRLTAYCETLLAIDASTTALSLAAKRCAELTNVRFSEITYPKGTLGSIAFDLIVLSEVVYYWSDDDITAAAVDIRSRLRPGGDIVLVHWTGDTDYPQSGDGAVAKLHAALGDLMSVQTAERRPEYRLDLWRRR